MENPHDQHTRLAKAIQENPNLLDGLNELERNAARIIFKTNQTQKNQK